MKSRLGFRVSAPLKGTFSMKDVVNTTLKTLHTSASRTSASTYVKESAIRGKQEKDKEEEEEERGVRLSFFLDDKILRIIMCLLSTACKTTKKRSIREAMEH